MTTDFHFEQAHKRLIEIEGFKSDRRTDPGGYTVWGISSRFWPDEFKHGDPSLQQAKAFYLREFWRFQKCHMLRDYAVAWELFEASVNCGRITGAKFAQAAYNKTHPPGWPDLKVDGVIGAASVAALNRMAERYLDVLVKAMNGMQFTYYVTLGDPHNIRGWVSKRVEFERTL